MFIKTGGGAAYQPDCLSLCENVPEELRIELYPDDKAELLMHESKSVTNRFGCERNSVGFEVWAENNSAVRRRYTVAVYAEEKEYSAEFEAEAGSVLRVTIK
jgi:hypothetical protein